MEGGRTGKAALNSLESMVKIHTTNSIFQFPYSLLDWGFPLWFFSVWFIVSQCLTLIAGFISGEPCRMPAHTALWLLPPCLAWALESGLTRCGVFVPGLIQREGKLSEWLIGFQPLSRLTVHCWSLSNPGGPKLARLLLSGTVIRISNKPEEEPGREVMMKWQLAYVEQSQSPPGEEQILFSHGFIPKFCFLPCFHFWIPV